ncbi:MAG: hypothetical protein ACJ767_00910 [Chloroflexota bacterium]
MVDLGGVVGIVGDHRRNDPAGRSELAPVRHPRCFQLGVIGTRGDMADKWSVSGLRPHDDLLRRALRPKRLDQRRALPVGAARSIAEIANHVGSCKVIYDDYAFGSGPLE